MKTMKNIIRSILNVLASHTFTNEKMPALIPVRVITKVHPDQHR